VHGGSTPTGLALPQTVTGRYSKHIPTRLAARYLESKSDPELLNLRDEISLLDSRISDIMESANNSESGHLWKSLKNALREYDKQARSSAKDADAKMADAFAQMRWLINEGYAEWQTWREAREIVQERKSLVDSERARLKDMQQMITAEQAMVFLARVTHAVRCNVKDPATLAAISRDIGAIANAGDTAAT
jgi:hypothetical protein